MLQTEATTDPLLERYKVIILDEAQDSSLATVLLFGLLKEMLKSRHVWTLGVMSVTLGAEKFQAYFNGSHESFRTFVYIQQLERDYVEAATQNAFPVHVCEAAGDILVFLSGGEDIEEACRKISLEVRNLGGQVGPVNPTSRHSFRVV